MFGILQVTAFLCAPGSDEEDGNRKKELSTDSTLQKDGAHHPENLRSLPEVARLSLSFPLGGFRKLPDRKGKYLYESIMILLLKVWYSILEKDDNEVAERNVGGSSESVETETIHGFFANLDFFLSLCVKSLVLRYDRECASINTPMAKATLDDAHQLLFESFVEMLGRGLIGQALVNTSGSQDREKALKRATQNSKYVMDFFVGVLSVIHPESFRLLFARYLKALRDAELQNNDGNEPASTWNTENIFRTRCSWQLRIDAIERLASIPSFIALNYPPKYGGQRDLQYSTKPTWSYQYFEIDAKSFSNFNALRQQDGVEKLPSNGWLAEMALEECLSICAHAGETVVSESEAQVAAISQGRSFDNSSLKYRPSASLNSDDLLMFQSVAIHAVSVVYELVLRRHASLDRRFQSESARSRIAAMFAQPILERSLLNAGWLSRMEATNRVRCVWLLCFIFVLQEAPDAMICDFISSCCNPNVCAVSFCIKLFDELIFCSFMFCFVRI